MKKLLSFVLLLFCLQLNAQTITGKIIDEDQNPIAYASVTANSTIDNRLLNGVLTSTDGHFELSTEAESFYIKIEFVGYAPKQIHEIQTNLGNITLESDNTLEEVVVSAQREIIEQKADRLVFNVENSATASGGDAIDALKITPGVRVNDDNIAILGKGTVQVMINDRIMQMKGEELVAYLGSIPADNIQKIEVITAPPAKYDAEGNSGLINIQLKQPKKGSWNNNMRTGYIQTTYPAITYGNTFTYNNGKLSLSADASGKKGNEGQLLTFNVGYPNGPWQGQTFFKEDETYTNTRLSLDYNIAKNTTIGGMYAGNFRNNTDLDWGVNYIYNLQNEQTGRVVSGGESNLNKKQHSANIHLIQKIDTLGRKISIDADYFQFDRPLNRVFSSERFGGVQSLLKARNTTNQLIENKSLKLDMEQPFEKLQLSYGVKYSITSTNSSVDFYNQSTGIDVHDPSQSNHFLYDEKVLAGYADASKSFGEKWQAKLGLRIEKTETVGESLTINQINKNEYTNVFPTAYLSNQINKNNSANVSYSKRIDRPGFWALNPFRFYVDQNSYAEGNPFLQPALTDNFELQHVYKGKLISKLYLSNTEKGHGEVSNVNAEENQLVVNRENFYSGTTYGLQETVMLSPTKKWNITSQASVYQTSGKLYDGFPNIKLRTGTSYSFYANNSYLLTDKHGISAELTTVYASPQYIYMFETSNIFSTDFAMKASFLQDKLSVNTSINDIFKTAAPDVYATSSGIEQVFNNYNDNRHFKLNIKYNFGNQKIKVRNRSFGNSDVQGRT